MWKVVSPVALQLQVFLKVAVTVGGAATSIVRKERQTDCSAGRPANTPSRVGDLSGVLMPETSKQVREHKLLMHACTMHTFQRAFFLCSHDYRCSCACVA